MLAKSRYIQFDSNLSWGIESDIHGYVVVGSEVFLIIIHHFDSIPSVVTMYRKEQAFKGLANLKSSLNPVYYSYSSSLVAFERFFDLCNQFEFSMFVSITFILLSVDSEWRVS